MVIKATSAAHKEYHYLGPTKFSCDVLSAKSPIAFVRDYPEPLILVVQAAVSTYDCYVQIVKV